MSANFYELLKYAATGQASPDMTYYDRMRASTLMGGGTVQTLTGIPPLTFKADGTPLISWSMKGNGQQSGTPTFCGVRTENLFDSTIEQGSFRIADGAESSSTTRVRSTFMKSALPSGTYTINANGVDDVVIYAYTTNSTSGYDNSKSTTSWKAMPYTFTTENSLYLRFAFRKHSEATVIPSEVSIVMLNSGSTSLPYEPFGYKISISCGGEITPIYVGEPLRKALDGSNAVDVLSSAGTITREVDAEGNALATPTTQIVDVPEIPTAEGQNTLTVDTTLQPSEMSITYKG